MPVISEIFPARVVETDLARQISGYPGEYTPMSSRLHSILREPLKELLPEDNRYESVFDRFECLFGLAFLDLNQRLTGESWAPVGRFAWKHRWEPTRGIVALIEGEIKEWGDEWPPLSAGLFDGSLDRLNQIMSLYKKEVLGKLHWG